VQDACSPNSSVAVPAPRGDLTTALVSQETRSLEATREFGMFSEWHKPCRGRGEP
jgi:hypothetical protein